MHDPGDIYDQVREKGKLTLEFPTEQEARDFMHRICALTEQVNVTIEGSNLVVEYVRIFD
jgi:hypothetical protein